MKQGKILVLSLAFLCMPLTASASTVPVLAQPFVSLWDNIVSAYADVLAPIFASAYGQGASVASGVTVVQNSITQKKESRTSDEGKARDSSASPSLAPTPSAASSDLTVSLQRTISDLTRRIGYLENQSTVSPSAYLAGYATRSDVDSVARSIQNQPIHYGYSSYSVPSTPAPHTGTDDGRDNEHTVIHASSSDDTSTSTATSTDSTASSSEPTLESVWEARFNALAAAQASSTFWAAGAANVGDIYYASGSVGIGTTTPDASLAVVGNISGVGELKLLGSDAAAAHIGLTDDINGYAGMDISSYQVTGSPYSYFNLIGSRGTVDSPSQLIAGDSLGEFNFYGMGSDGYQLLGARISSIAENDFGSSPEANLIFSTNESERMRIVANGNIGIGTNVPTAQLSTTGSVRFGGLGAGSVQTDSKGNLITISDDRLADVQGSFASGLDALDLITPITYKWNSASGYDTDSAYAGFSAQNIQSAIPEAVSEDANGFLTLSDRPILAAAINAIKEIGSITGTFKDRVVAWLGDAGNGITSLFAGRVVTQELCLGDDSDSVCVTKDQLKTLLENAGLSQSQSQNQSPSIMMNSMFVPSDSGNSENSDNSASSGSSTDQNASSSSASSSIESDANVGSGNTGNGGDNTDNSNETSLSASSSDQVSNEASSSPSAPADQSGNDTGATSGNSSGDTGNGSSGSGENGNGGASDSSSTAGTTAPTSEPETTPVVPPTE